MTSDDQLIAELARLNPVSATPPADAALVAEAERILARVLESGADRAAGRPRRTARRGILAPLVSVVIVLVVLAVFLRLGSSGERGAVSAAPTTIVFVASPTPSNPTVTAAVMRREVAAVRRRLATVTHGFTVRRSGRDQLVVTLPAGTAAERARAVALTLEGGQLRFYDWETSVLTPNGKTAASQLKAQNATALELSTGGAAGSPGLATGGGLSLYDAVKLASKQPVAPASRRLSRLGPEYYRFGAPGSRACAAAARATGTLPTPGDRCLLSGPDDTIAALRAGLPAGVAASAGQTLAVPQGIVVLQAEPQTPPEHIAVNSPSARFFVLRDNVALPGQDLTNPRAGRDQSGSPDVQFGFTTRGAAEFRAVTTVVARRGQDVSTGGQMLDQHFAIAVDSQLLTVPQIDFRQYPDGIIGGGGADATGALTTASARALATELRLGALPLRLSQQSPG
jgi:SecD/SecF fusion protein